MSRTYERLVRDVWGWWYEQAEQVGPKRLKDVLDDLLSDPLFDFTKGKGMAKFDKRFEDKMAVLTESAALLELTPKLVKPSRMWLRFRDRVRRSRVPFAWRETVTHGDLHGDNIFCDTAGSSVWLIDFARTARRIDIFDLAMLESDLKFRHLPTLVRGALGPEFMARYRRFESDLASQRAYERLVLPEVDGVPELRTVSKLVADIRQLAAQRLTRRGSNLDYMMVLFLLALKYMKLKEMTAPEVLLPYTSASEILARAFQRRGKRR